tara:strand:+ start:4681 stop:6747 length:2067 start_codon:yes stop_codon:yes gene_type:complete
MAVNASERLRLAYEYKLGKDLTSKLSDDQIKKLSQYYNSLPPNEQSKVDSDIIKGGGEFLDIARGMAGMMEVEMEGDKKFTPNAEKKPQGPMRPPSKKGGDVYSKRASDSEIAGGDLTTYEGTKGTDLVDKEVDERILRLLGLEEVFDIDYATYLSLLKERMAAARMANSPIPTEETELLTNEFKSVKSKVGRFKIKKKRITADDIRSSAPKVPKALLSPLESGSREDLTPNQKSAIESDLEPIDNKLDELINVIRKDFAAENKQQKLESRKEQNKARDERESKREQKKQSNILVSAAKGAVKPFTGILDRLKKFAMFTFAGFLADKVIKFFTDPANVKKREAVLNFLEDHGPKIFAGALLLLTPLGGLFVGLTATILKVIGGVGGGILLKAIGLLATPLGLKALALALAAAGGFATVEAIKDISAGGSGLRAAIEANNKRAREQGIEIGKFGQGFLLDESGKPIYSEERIPNPFNPGMTSIKTFQATVETRDVAGNLLATPEQLEAYTEWKRNNDRLTAERKAMSDEIAKARKEIMGDTSIPLEARRLDFEARRAEITREYNQKYIEQYGNPSTFQNLFGVNQPTNESPKSTASSATQLQVTEDNQRYGTTFPAGSFSISPISPISAVDPLPIGSVVNHIRLPDKFETVSANLPVKSGTEIPDFKIVNPYPHRSKVTDALGIGYLVG